MTKTINGNTAGIREFTLNTMKSMYLMSGTADEFVSPRLIAMMCAYTGAIGREIAACIARDGSIVDISIGDSSKVNTPSLRLVRNIDRLCGVRLIHTHPSGDPRLSDVDLGTLRTSLLDAICSIGVRDGMPTAIYTAFIDEPDPIICGPINPDRIPHANLLARIEAADARLKTSTVLAASLREKAIVAGMSDDRGGYSSIDELAALADAAGANVIARFTQRRRPIDNATYIGKGKLNELTMFVAQTGADLVIFDDELSATQLRNIENAIGIRVIDRTTLILDIFARRASSREGKLQVELAQLKYRLPRLLGSGLVLSRLGGGIGTRGPGEKQLELDRRIIRRRIYELEQELKTVDEQRDLRRARRENASTPLVALMGYTNAGKSTLINALTGSGEFVSNMLFATLDTVVRKTTLPQGTEVLVSDTVGFIDKLPHDLVNAFRSTLQEVCSADIILHVVDSSEPAERLLRHIGVAIEVLNSLGAANIPRILVLNKADIATELTPDIELTLRSNDIAAIVPVSALTGSGLDHLLSTLENTLTASLRNVTLAIPYDRFDLVAFIRTSGLILSESYTDSAALITARLDSAALGKLHSEGIEEVPTE